jgi:hypothetical protein
MAKLRSCQTIKGEGIEIARLCSRPWRFDRSRIRRNGVGLLGFGSRRHPLHLHAVVVPAAVGRIVTHGGRIVIQRLHVVVGIAVAAITGVLAARGKRIDLFGVLVLALVTAFGGGTVRDLLVGDFPVVWLRGPESSAMGSAERRDFHEWSATALAERTTASSTASTA